MSGALAQFPARKHPGTFWQTLRIIGSCHAGCADNMAIKCSVIPARLLLFFGVFFVLFPLYFVQHIHQTPGQPNHQLGDAQFLNSVKKKKSRGLLHLPDSGAPKFPYSASLCKFQWQKKYKKFWFSFFHDFFDMFCCDFSLKKFENHQFSTIFIDFHAFSVRNHNKTCEKNHEKMKTENFYIFLQLDFA